MDEMIVTAWSNGSLSASGYGLRLSKSDRDAFFRREVGTVFVALPDGSEVLAIGVRSASFWKDCPELRSSGIGRWLRRRGTAPWPKRKPPKLRLIREAERRFRFADI